MLAYLKRHKKCLLLLWTKATTMLDWGSSSLDITTAGIVGLSYCCMVLGIVLCWCCHCLLTVGGNWLPHAVTPLDVTTVVWCCGETKDVVLTAECYPAALQTSEWQWTARVNTVWQGTESSGSPFSANKCYQHNLTLWFGCWTGETDKCFYWYSPLRYIS
jgi:hypothetical protein